MAKKKLNKEVKKSLPKVNRLGAILTNYNFPEHSLTIPAVNIEEAKRKLKVILEELKGGE